MSGKYSRIAIVTGATKFAVHALAEGFGHGLVHLWAEDGTLLATASQSAIVRNPRKDDA